MSPQSLAALKAGRSSNKEPSTTKAELESKPKATKLKATKAEATKSKAKGTSATTPKATTRRATRLGAASASAAGSGPAGRRTVQSKALKPTVKLPEPTRRRRLVKAEAQVILDALTGAKKTSFPVFRSQEAPFDLVMRCLGVERAHQESVHRYILQTSMDERLRDSKASRSLARDVYDVVNNRVRGQAVFPSKRVENKFSPVILEDFDEGYLHDAETLWHVGEYLRKLHHASRSRGAVYDAIRTQESTAESRQVWQAALEGVQTASDVAGGIHRALSVPRSENLSASKPRQQRAVHLLIEQVQGMEVPVPDEGHVLHLLHGMLAMLKS